MKLGKVVDLWGQLPPLSPLQLEILSQLFPDRAPDAETPEPVIRFRAGQASVVRNLKEHASKKASTVGGQPHVLRIQSQPVSGASPSGSGPAGPIG